MPPKKKAADLENHGSSSSNKKAKLPSLSQHIELILDEETGKVSLQALKTRLKEARNTDFSKGAPNTQLKKVLTKGCEDNKFVKFGGSYATYGYQEPQPEESAQETGPERISNAKWIPLKVMSKEFAKSGRSKCQQCGQLIEEGARRLQVLDVALFEVCCRPNDCHEGVSRGYVEGVAPMDVVSRRKFFIHPGCLADANASCEAAFWTNLSMIQLHDDQ